MQRTTIMLPESLHERALRYAHEKKVSLGQLIRDALCVALQEDRRVSKGDCLLRDAAVYRGSAPKDLSEQHDRYLYGEPD